jgi:hypothetical protein
MAVFIAVDFDERSRWGISPAVVRVPSVFWLRSVSMPVSTGGMAGTVAG